MALVSCLVLLTGWRIGPPLTFFDEEGAIERTVGELSASGERFSRILSIAVTPTELTIEAQDPANVRHINRWRVVRMNLRSLNWEAHKGPSPVALNLINPDLEANLFDLREIDFKSAGALLKESVARSALEDPGQVTSMEIRRQLFLLPKPSSGDVRWTVNVTSGRESASAVADAKGKIVRLDLSGTNRAKTLDLFKSLDLLPEAAQAFEAAAGSGPLLIKARVTSRNVTFETNVSEKTPLFASLKQRRTYSWSLNGLERTLGGVDTSEHFGADPPFSIWDADWTQMDALIETARGELKMEDAAVAEIELFKPKDQATEPRLEWKIVLEDQNREKGSARFDAKSGELIAALAPESRRTPFDARDPAQWPGLFAKIETTFGASGSIAELLLYENHIAIVADDPQKPGALAQFLLDGEGIKRFGSVSPFAAQNPRFTVNEIRALTGDQMRKLRDQTAKRLGLPPPKIVNITVGKASMDPSPRGTVTVEIRAEEAPFGRGGRVNWEIDGREIKAYLP